MFIVQIKTESIFTGTEGPFIQSSRYFLKILQVINSPKYVGDKRITRVFIKCVKHSYDSDVMHHFSREFMEAPLIINHVANILYPGVLISLKLTQRFQQNEYDPRNTVSKLIWDPTV